MVQMERVRTLVDYSFGSFPEPAIRPARFMTYRDQQLGMRVVRSNGSMFPSYSGAPNAISCVTMEEFTGTLEAIGQQTQERLAEGMSPRTLRRVERNWEASIEHAEIYAGQFRSAAELVLPEGSLVFTTLLGISREKRRKPHPYTAVVNRFVLPEGTILLALHAAAVIAHPENVSSNDLALVGKLVGTKTNKETLAAKIEAYNTRHEQALPLPRYRAGRYRRTR